MAEALGLEGTLDLLERFDDAGIILRYEHGKLRPWPRDALTSEFRALIKRHRGEICALLRHDIIRLEVYGWAVARRFRCSHELTAFDYFELVAERVFGFGEARQYFLMERGCRPPN